MIFGWLIDHIGAGFNQLGNGLIKFFDNAFYPGALIAFVGAMVGINLLYRLVWVRIFGRSSDNVRVSFRDAAMRDGDSEDKKVPGAVVRVDGEYRAEPTYNFEDGRWE